MVADASVGLNFESLEDFVIICDFMNEDEDNVSFNAIRCYMLRNLNRIDISNRPYLLSYLPKAESNVLHFATDKRKFRNTNQPCLQHKQNMYHQTKKIQCLHQNTDHLFPR